MKHTPPPHLAPLIPPFMISTALKAVQAPASHSILSSVYYEVTVLDKVVRVFLRPQYSSNEKTSEASPTGSKVKAITTLLTTHFDISVWLIETPLLVDAVTKQIVWSDEDLRPFKPYFLAFMRIGQEVTQASFGRLKRKNPKNFKLLNRSFFSLKNRPSRLKQAYELPQGRIELLRLVKGQLALAPSSTSQGISKSHQNDAVKRENDLEEIKDDSESQEIENDVFTCPFMDCGRVFHRPCDLYFHFLVQTDCKPFTCDYCQLKFRRKTLLKKHEGSCLMLRNKLSQFNSKQPIPVAQPQAQIDNTIPLAYQLPPVPPLEEPIQSIQVNQATNMPDQTNPPSNTKPVSPRFYPLLKLAQTQMTTNIEVLKAWETTEKEDKKKRGSQQAELFSQLVWTCLLLKEMGPLLS